MFGLNRDEIDAATERAAQSPFDPARDVSPGFFQGSLNAVGNIPESSAAGLLLAGNVIGGKLYGQDEEDAQFRSDLVEVQNSLRPDPSTTGMLGNIIYGVGKILPQAAVGSVGGPAGAAGVVGLTQGIEEAERLKAEGVDPGTASKAGAIEGVTQGVGVVIPASMGARLATRLASGSALNVGLGGISRGATGKILEANGYKEMADQYRILDGTAILTDAILGGVFGAVGGHSEAKIPKHDPINDNHPGDLDVGLAGNSVRQFELDSAPGIPTDLATRNAHTKAMDIGISQMLAGREVDIGDTLENTTFLTRQPDPGLQAAFREAAIDNDISPILLENRRLEEAVVQSIIDQSMRNAGRSRIEAESVSPLFARTLARFANAFGEPITDAFNKNLLEFQQLDEQNRIIALGNNVTSLLNDITALRSGRELDPNIAPAVADFGDRLDQLGITPEQARLLPAQELLDQVYNVGRPVVEGSEQLPTVEVGQNEEGQVTLSLRQSPQPVNPEFQAQITDRLMQAPAVEKSPLGFVSKMERVLGEKLNNTGTVDQFKQQLDAFQKGGQFKADERFWSGIDDFLDNMKEMDGDAKLSKQDILDYLTNNRFKLIEYGEDQVGGGPVVEPLNIREFDESSDIDEPDDSYIRENARDYYEDDIRKEKEAENSELPEDEQKSPEELDREIEQEAFDRALEAYNEDPYNVITTYTNSITLPGGERVHMEIRDRGNGDFVEYTVGDRDWKDTSSVDNAMEEIQLAIAEDYGVQFDSEGAVPFEEYTGEGGSNYRFFRLATDELKGGEFYKQGHYPERNVLLHMRTKDRVGPNGEKMLFIEEMQSDIHQQAYKSKLESGISYRTEIDQAKIDELHNKITETQGRIKQSMDDADKLYLDMEKAVDAELPGLDPSIIEDHVKSIRGSYYDNPTHHLNQAEASINAPGLLDKALLAQLADEIDAPAMYYIKGAARGLQSVVESPRYNGQPFADLVKKYFDDVVKMESGRNADPSMFSESERNAGIESARKWMTDNPPKIYTREQVQAALIKVADQYRDLASENNKQHSAAMIEEQEARTALNATKSAPPAAPFSKTWREVGFKRLLARAADEGYDSVGWTVGTQQNARYNLSRFIDRLEARKNTSDAGDTSFTIKAEGRVLDAIEQSAGGKPLSRGSGFIQLSDEQLDTALGKAGADSVRRQAQEGGITGFKRVDFEKDIEVGGERKGNLYDQMLPQEAGKILKKLDPSIKVAEKDYSIRESGRDIGKIWYAPLTEKAKQEIMQGFELFQQERGAITFNSASAKDFEGRLRKVIIEFSQAADESTAIHEFSHWAVATHRMYADIARKRLEAGDLNPEIQRISDDWETLKKEVGAKDDVFTREQEEKIASWFEGYARTGEAPSERLQAIFDRFREWLTKIYQDITGRGMEVSPAVRGVFDRWLADADEIRARQEKDAAAARADQGGAGPGDQTGTPEQSLDPVQQILADKPELTVIDENGNEIAARDAIADAQQEVTQAQQDAKLFDVAITCFLRHSDA